MIKLGTLIMDTMLATRLRVDISIGKQEDDIFE
jgi:hypothetical protein